MHNHVKALLLVCIALQILLSGCASTTAPSVTTLTPTAGSVFVEHSFETDSSGTMIKSTEHFDTLTVAAVHQAFEGKTDVMKLQASSGRFIYRNFESNGDFTIFADGMGKPGYQTGWVLFPVASKASSVFAIIDTVVFGSRQKQLLTISVVGEQDKPYAGHTFHVVGIEEALSGYGTPDGSAAAKTVYWVAPDLGLTIGIDRLPFHHTQSFGNGYWDNGYHSELLSYTIK